MFCLGLKFQQFCNSHSFIKVCNGYTIKSINAAFIVALEMPLSNQSISLLNDSFDGPFQYRSPFVPVMKPLENLTDPMVFRPIAFAVENILRENIPKPGTVLFQPCS